MKKEHSFITKTDNKTAHAIYYDQEHIAEMEGKNIHSVHAFCFYQDKLLVVYGKTKKYWHPVGGGVEPGETYEEAVIREVHEESNMKVLKQKLVAFQDSWVADAPEKVVTQTRSVCLVEPYGEFIEDPDEEITEIKLIDPKDYKQYFDWGETGDRLMEQVLEHKDKLL